MGTQQYIKDMLVVKAAEKTVGRNLSQEEMSPEIGVELPTGKVVFIPQLAFPMELIPGHASSINEDHLDWFTSTILPSTPAQEEQFQDKLFKGEVTAMPKTNVTQTEPVIQAMQDTDEETLLGVDGEPLDEESELDEDELYVKQNPGMIFVTDKQDEDEYENFLASNGYGKENL